jgi:hypothetical protein
MSRKNAQALLDALDSEFGWGQEKEYDPEPDYPWRDRQDDFFTPQALQPFLKHLGVSLFPQQEADLQQLLGIDPKQVFERDNGQFQQGIFAYGKGCLGENEQLTDWFTGLTKTVKEWEADGRSLLLPSWDGEQVVLNWTSPVYRKGTAELFRITLADGRSFVATAKHKCLTPTGWLQVHQFELGVTQVLTRPLSSSAQKLDSQPCRKAWGDESHCVESGGLASEQSHECTAKSRQECDRVYHCACGACGHDDCLLTRPKSVRHELSKEIDFQDHCHPSSHLSDALLHEALRTCPTCTPSLGDVLVQSVEPLQEGDFYDLTVPGTHCYFDSQGLLHHNSGKDFMVSCVMIWAIHILLCLKNPQKYLGQADNENIDVITVAYNQLQIRTVLFFKIKQRLKASTWFKGAIARLVPDVTPERYLKEGGGWVGADSILFPLNLRMWAVPSTPDSAEGKNPILWCCDEIAAFSSPTTVNNAAKIHQMLESSARTRFGDRYKGMLISFPRHKGDYLMQLIEMAQKGQISDTFVSVKATWEVNPNVTRASLQPHYDKNPEDAACRYECKPPSAVDAYFKSPDLLLLHASGAPLWLLEQHLELPDEQLQAIANLGQSPITDVDDFGDPRLDRRGFPKLARWFRGQKNSGGDAYEYYVHLDPGLSGDGFGLAMGHIHEIPSGGFSPVVDIAFRWTGAQFRDFGEIFRQSWFSDTVNQTETVTAAEVDFRTVREFLFYLRYARGFNIALVTIDGWNSADSIQELRRRDIPVGMRIVNKEDYDEFKSLVYNRQLRYYAYPILINESVKLQLINGTKVEAPRTSEGGEDGSKNKSKNNSHKDVSDAVAAVCRRLVTLKDESVAFYKFPPIEDIWDKSQRQNKPIKLEASPQSVNESQRAIMQQFFND